MAQSFTTDTLIASIKRRISIPTSQNTYADEDILAFVNEEMSLNIVPSIISLYEGHFLRSDAVDLEANVSNYTIPLRAVGNKLNDVQFVDNNDNKHMMTRIAISDIPHYQGAYTQNHAYTYYIENNKVSLLPPIEDSPDGQLIFIYYIRPNELVAEDRVATITAIDTATGEISVDFVPDHFTTNIEYDMYMANSPHKHLSVNLSASSVNSTTNVITFDPDDLSDDLEVGDHLAMASECMIPQIPSDLHALLAQFSAERILESQGDTQGLQNAKVKSAEMKMAAGTLIDNRVESDPQKLVNRSGPLRSGLRNRRYSRRG